MERWVSKKIASHFVAPALLSVCLSQPLIAEETNSITTSAVSATISEIQNKLEGVGCEPGPATGVLTPETMAAIQRYVEYTEYDTEEKLDAASLLDSLSSEDTTSCGSENANTQRIATVQERLNALNCGAGPIDGIPGRRTVSAIKRFLDASNTCNFDYFPGIEVNQAFVSCLQSASTRCPQQVAINERRSNPFLGLSIPQIKFIIAGQWTLTSECPGDTIPARGSVYFYNEQNGVWNAQFESRGNESRNGRIEINYSTGRATGTFTLTNGTRISVDGRLIANISTSGGYWYSFEASDNYGCTIRGLNN